MRKIFIYCCIVSFLCLGVTQARADYWPVPYEEDASKDMKIGSLIFVVALIIIVIAVAVYKARQKEKTHEKTPEEIPKEEARQWGASEEGEEQE